MKKLWTVFAVALIMLLAACGGQPTAGDVLKDAIEANEKLDSYSSDMKIETEAMGMKVTIEASGDVTHNPDTMYLDMSMGMMGFSIDFEAYVVDEEMYMGMFESWFIVEDDEMELGDFDQLTQEQLEGLESLAEKFEMTEEDGAYVLTLSGEGEDFEEVIKPFLEASLADMTEDFGMGDEFSDFTVNSLDLELKIDKKSKIIQSQSVTAELEVDGETYTVDVEVNISNVGEVEPIEIPEEVKENAVTEEEFDDLFGFADDFDDDYSYFDESMSLDEIREIVDYTIPELTYVPEDYTLTESIYDEMFDSVYVLYEKDQENYIIYSIYPTSEVYDEIFFDETTDEMLEINGNEAVLEVFDDYYLFLTWVQDGSSIELLGEGPDMTKEILIEIAESAK